MMTTTVRNNKAKATITIITAASILIEVIEEKEIEMNDKRILFPTAFDFVVVVALILLFVILIIFEEEKNEERIQFVVVNVAFGSLSALLVVVTVFDAVEPYSFLLLFPFSSSRIVYSYF